MLSIGSMGGGSGKYYLDLAREDYYFQGGEPLGKWWGQGAEKLTGMGTVAKDDLKFLLRGLSIDGKPLVQNAGKEKRQVGWDLTFSAPKSVSVLWSQADRLTRDTIQAAHYEAVKAALSYIEQEVAYTRRGKGGEKEEKVGLVVATFEHGTSREMDPQLHTHALILNLGIREDGTTGTILSKPFYLAKMAAGALYRAEFAQQLERRLGIICEREERGGSFRLAGVADQICHFFSKRRAQVEEHLNSHGGQGAAASAAAAYESRRKKDDVPPRSELFQVWQELAQPFGFDQERVVHQAARPHDPKKEFRAALSDALQEITWSESHFTSMQLLHRTAVYAQGRGLSANQIRDGVKDALADPREIVSLGEYKGQQRYTTPEIMKLEKDLIKQADRLHNSGGHTLTDTYIDKVMKENERPMSAIAAELKHHATQLWKAARKQDTDRIDRDALRAEAKRPPLTEEQKKAVHHLTNGQNGDVRILEGWAGTGKTSTLRAARQVWEAADYRVVGVAVGGKAAKELNKGAGIESFTYAKFDRISHPTMKDVLEHEGRQFVRAVKGKHLYDMEPFKLDSNTVLVVDEASMCSSKQLHRLMSDAAKAGAVVVLLGDRKQLPAIEAGGGFAYMGDRYGKAELTDIVRQNEEWVRHAVRQFADGDAKGALKQYDLAGRLHVAEDREKAIEKLVSDWTKYERGREHESQIFVGTRQEAHELNTRCQRARLNAGDLSESRRATITARGVTDSKGTDKTTFDVYQGDRVLFTERSTKLGVENGDTGTVIGIKKQLTSSSNIFNVKLDSGEIVSIPLNKYDGVRLGYAMTTHAGQGTTVQRAYLLAGGRMTDRAMTYVQGSRAIEPAHIYTDKYEAGDNLSRLAQQMSQEKEKTLAHAVSEAHNVAREQQDQRERQRTRERERVR